MAVMGAVENVGKAERLLRSFFQAPGGNHQTRSWPKADLIRFPQVRHFQQRFVPADFLGIVLRKW